MFSPYFLNAHLWISEGILFKVISVKNPPQFNIEFVAYTSDWIKSHWYNGSDHEDVAIPVQKLIFELIDWGIGGEVCHYRLANTPPEGYLWTFYNEQILISRVEDKVYV